MMATSVPPPDPCSVSDCKLDPRQLETQLERYRQLGRHATRLERLSGEVVVRFGDDLPSDLLAHALEVERGCCPFVHAAYDPADRELTLSVETIDQAPVLDSLADAFEVTRCCAPDALATCCEPDDKDACCGSAATTAPASCGCTR
jgi:hypothetical protein